MSCSPRDGSQRSLRSWRGGRAQRANHRHSARAKRRPSAARESDDETRAARPSGSCRPDASGAVVGAAWAAAGHHVVATSGVSRESVRRAAALLPDVPLLPPDEVVRAGRPRAARRARRRAARPRPRPRGGRELPRRPDRGAHLGRARGGRARARGRARRAAARPAPRDDVHGPRRGRGPAGRRERRRHRGARDEAGWSVGEALVVEMGAEPVRIPEAVRPLYHAALAHGANHLVTLVRDCVDTLEPAGVHPADRLVAPLLSAALDNALRHGDRALTGPVARGDVGHRPHPPPGARPRPRRHLPGARRAHAPTAPRPRGCSPSTRSRTCSPRWRTAHDAHRRAGTPRASSPCTRAPRASARSRGPCAAPGAAWRSCRRWARCTRATAS